MRIRLDLATLLLPTALAGLAVVGTSTALAQQVVRLESEPAGLKMLPARVSGRSQTLPEGGMRRQWPGTYAEAAFVGSDAYFRVGPGDVSLRLRVDGEAPIALVKPAPGLYRVTVPHKAASHRIRVDVASESQAGATTFGGFFLTANAKPATLPVRKHQIEFIGDSHTVGYGNTSPSRDCSGEQVWEFTDTSVGVAPKVAARYDADYQVNAISGRGIVRNFNGFSADFLPQAYPFVLFDKATEARDPNWRPQAIVISLGTNDFAMPLHDGEKWTQREQLRADFETTYADFVYALHRQQPQAYILLWAAGGEDTELATEVRKVAQLVRQSSDTQIDFVAVPNLTASACHYHPSVADDQTIALALTRHLQAHAPSLGTPLAVAETAATPAASQSAQTAQTATASQANGQLINDPKTATWGVYGSTQSNESVAKGGPKGYPITRVTVNTKGNPWDVGATSSLNKPIEAGDAVLMAIYLRAPALKDGETTPVTYFGINESSAPYTSVVKGSAEVTNQWQVFYASGQAAKSYSPGQVAPGMHLAADKHVLELGPTLIYNYGKNADLAKLPTPPTLLDASEASSAPAKAEGQSAGQLVNDAKTAGWNLYGSTQSNETIPGGGPKGYPMTRVTVSVKGNPWDVGATSSLNKPIAAGDAVLVAVYLRAPALKDGESTPVPYFGLNETAAPYASFVKGAAEVTNQWQVFYASGLATKTYNPGQVAPGMHLAAAKHVLELGPMLVYDFGQNMDLAKLPTPPVLVDATEASSAPAKAGGKPVGRLINDLKTATWSVYGANQSTEALAQGGPKDYPMTRVTVSAKGNPWDVGASSPLNKPVAAGDTVLVAVYLRAPTLKDGETTPVTYFGVNENSPPYSNVAKGSADVTNQWKVYFASGSASKAFTPDQLAVGMHLGAAKHVLELGPVLVYNYGQNVDPAKLPR